VGTRCGPGLACLALVSFLGSSCAGGCSQAPPRFDPAARRTCLVLSVGGPRGVAHLGAIAAVRKAGLRIDCVVGNSMGSLVGALYASAPAVDTDVLFRRFSAAYLDETKRDYMKNGAIGAAIGSALGAVIGAVAGEEHGKKVAVAGAVLGAGAGAMLGAQQTAKLDRDRLVRVMDGLLAGARIEALPVPYATTYEQRAGDGLSVVVSRDGNLAEAVFRLEADFTRAVKAGYDATAKAL